MEPFYNYDRLGTRTAREDSVRMISLSLPLGVGDNRIDAFWSVLAAEINARGGLAQGQVDFFTHPTKIRSVYVLVYEAVVIDLITDALREALGSTWPEHTNLYVIESLVRGESIVRLGMVRGGKGD
ncbi:MAG TPA: hypothetical protein VGB97_04125 [Candidatus Paceibacterota bacterium]